MVREGLSEEAALELRPEGRKEASATESGRNGIHTEEIASTRVLTSASAPSIGGRDVSVGRLGQKRVQCGCSPRHGAG